MLSAAEITCKAKSNLSYALLVLPKSLRADMTIFYAFCRTIDDIADDVHRPKLDRQAELERWEFDIQNGFVGSSGLGQQVAKMMHRRGISPEWMMEIIDGCKMDLEPRTFQGWDQLADYNWKVAGVVGLICTRIFGCVHEKSDQYARLLGNAMQLTNILRDVGEDLAKGGRIYLPVNDMMRFQYSERDLVGKVYDGRFLALMSYQAERAEHYFQDAEKWISEQDRKALLPARIMAATYRCLLKKMKADQFQVFHQRYRITKFQKISILIKYLLSGAGEN